MMRRFFAWVLLAAVFFANTAVAQNAGIVLINSDDVYQRSTYAAFLRSSMETDRVALADQNAALFADLEAEELALTQQRPSMTPVDFQAAAAAFDAKVKRTRREQDQKELDLQQQLVGIRREFFTRIQPVVLDIMRERGASVVLEEGTVLFGLQDIIITDLVIARVDEAFARAQQAQDDQ